MNIWAFNKINDEVTRKLVYESFKSGKSRFGWSKEDSHNLLLKDNWTDWHSKQLFLLQVKPGDWIVHINTPYWGRCIAGKVTSTYQFDEGLKCHSGTDYRHNFDIDQNTVIEFDRRDPNILPSVNLNPRQRYHRIYAVNDFLLSIQNLKRNVVNIKKGEMRQEYHLKEKINPLLEKIIYTVHEMNKGKQLERFLAKVFRQVPGVVDVKENGFGWGTDYGADLIVTFSNSFSNLEFENRVIVQVKSFSGEHYDLSAVSQVKEGIEHFNGTAGMIITTAKKTEKLENKINEVSEEIGKPIDLLAHTDLARFIIKHAPELLFNLDGLSRS